MKQQVVAKYLPVIVQRCRLHGHLLMREICRRNILEFHHNDYTCFAKVHLTRQKTLGNKKNKKTYKKVYVKFAHIKYYMYLCNVKSNKMLNLKQNDNE